MIIRCEPNLKNTFPSLHSPWCLCPSHWEHRDMGNGSYGQSITGCLCCCSGRGVLPLISPMGDCSPYGCWVPPMGDSSLWTSSAWVFPTGCSSNVGPFPQDAALQKHPAPICVTQRVTSPARKTALVRACHSMGPKFPDSSLLHHGLPKKVIMASSYSRSIWTMLYGSWFKLRLPCVKSRVGLDDLCRSLLTQDLLWFYSVILYIFFAFFLSLFFLFFRWC